MKKKIVISTIILSIFLCLGVITFVNAEQTATQQADAEILPDDGAIITAVEITQTKTGTGPFDSDNEPGNDESEDNNIVRSFDQITWTIDNTMAVNGGEAESYKGGKIYFEATLPEDLNDVPLKWDTDSMKWISDPEITNNGLTLSGYYQMSNEVVTVPGKQDLVFVLKLYGVKNKVEIKPTFKTWLQGNGEEEYKSVEASKTIVSAAPNYNVALTRGALAKKTEADFGDEKKIGRMYGYGVVFQLHNKDVNKGLKGIEYPEGKIKIDITTKLEKVAIDNTENVEDITDKATPILYDYKINAATNLGNLGRDMDIAKNGISRYLYTAAPVSGSTDRARSVYDSGNVSIVQEGSKLYLELDNYKFDGVFPYTAPAISSVVFPENIGCFGVVYFELLVPENEYSNESDYNYYLEVADSNLRVESVGEEEHEQIKKTDDLNRRQHVVYQQGTYSQDTRISSATGGPNPWSNGNGYTILGRTVTFWVSTISSSNNDMDSRIYTLNKLVKFDGDAYEPILSSNNYYTTKNAEFNGESFKYKMWFVTKPDGTNWTSQQERNNAKISDLKVYERLEDIPEGHICVGEYFESISGYTENGYQIININLKVKETAKVGQTYALVHDSYGWTEKLDRSIYTVTNCDVEYPKEAFKFENGNYLKTEYDDNNAIIPGTHNGGHIYGQTLLMLSANAQITKKAIAEDGSEKVNYDFNNNEYEAKFQITPTIKTMDYYNVQIEGIHVLIEDTLPNGMTYISGSSNAEYGEPDVEKNSDGTTKLKWNLYNITSGKDITPITYKVHLSETLANGTSLQNTTTLSEVPTVNEDGSKEYKLGNVPSNNKQGREATASIQIINLASHRLYKTTDKPVVEKNEEIHFETSYKNNTDGTIPDFQLLDILPYIGDNRGTNYHGTYKLDRIVITYKDGEERVLDASNFKIKYTTDESVRKTANSKDEELGEGWTEVHSGDIIGQNATAFAVIGEVCAQGAVDVDIYLKPEGNEGKDVYSNSATAQVYTNTEEMQTPSIQVHVVHRLIEGIAWEDKNANGVKDNDEQLLQNVEMTLTNDEDEQVTDVDGEVVAPVRTDNNGYYKFEKLPKGNYYVSAKTPSSKYELTQKQVGSNTTVNSKFNTESSQTDEITKLDSLDLPEITVSYVNAGFVKKETKVVVEYKEKGTEGTEETLYDNVEIPGRIDDPYTTEDKLDEINENYDNKYQFVETTGDETEGEMTEAEKHVTYWYEKKDTKVVVLHVLKGTDVSKPEEVTNVLYPTETKTGKVDSAYSTQNRLTEINNSHKEQYKLVTDDVENKSGNMTLDTIYVIYEYETTPAKVKVRHLEKGTNEELYPEETKNGLVGEDYTTSPKDIEKYEVVEEMYPTEPNGTFTEEEKTVTYYYQKKATKVIVKYLEEETENVLHEEIEILGRIDDEYITEDKVDEINENLKNKYILTRTTENTEGLMTEDVIEVIYYYKKVEARVEVKHLDVDTNEELAEDEQFGGYVGDEYTTKPKDIEGYEVVEERMPKNKDGVYSEEDIIVTYYYKKVPEKPELPDTGDIAVVALVCVAVVSVIGIVYVVLKNKKKINNN